MFNLTKKHKKDTAHNANSILHNWSRDDELDAIGELSEAKKVHSLKDLFEIHRVMQEYKERKGAREEKADTRLLRHSVH